ncbi:hypothetical protein [Burkholderia cepacia]|uniref:hypothetical protein n=1 Tax=Burkholderia cepacia TaxID=292 RepID=UPI002AB5FF69|nr:hypothetical protein [Burkholderia cepacia]
MLGFLFMAPFSPELEPPQNSGRFRQHLAKLGADRIHVEGAASVLTKRREPPHASGVVAKIANRGAPQDSGLDEPSQVIEPLFAGPHRASLGNDECQSLTTATPQRPSAVDCLRRRAEIDRHALHQMTLALSEKSKRFISGLDARPRLSKQPIPVYAALSTHSRFVRKQPIADSDIVLPTLPRRYFHQ